MLHQYPFSYHVLYINFFTDLFEIKCILVIGVYFYFKHFYKSLYMMPTSFFNLENTNMQRRINIQLNNTNGLKNKSTSLSKSMEKLQKDANNLNTSKYCD